MQVEGLHLQREAQRDFVIITFVCAALFYTGKEKNKRRTATRNDKF